MMIIIIIIIRVYMKKRMTGEHRNDFNNSESTGVLGMFQMCGTR